jgi:hypothetical protein
MFFSKKKRKMCVQEANLALFLFALLNLLSGTSFPCLIMTHLQVLLAISVLGVRMTQLSNANYDNDYSQWDERRQFLTCMQRILISCLSNPQGKLKLIHLKISCFLKIEQKMKERAKIMSLF